MCDLCLPRRAVLAGAAGLLVAGRAGVASAVPITAVVPAQGVPAIVPRAEWGPDLAPTGPIPDEPDVRFLLVHHTVNANDYGPDDAVGLLAGIHRFHTTDRGWPDIAYNFLIDRFGTVYEGRTGSLAGPKAADATGGSQGFAQLCCFIGDHSVEPPSDAALGSMVGMLAFLGDRHGLDLAPGATTTFTSRGSNRRPAGEEVTTPTISGHRDMSSTACPGDAAYTMVADGTFARLATEARGGSPAPPVDPTTTTGAPPTTATAEPSTTTGAPTTTAPSSSTTTAPTGAAVDVTDEDGDGGTGLLVPAGLAAVAAAGAGAVIALRHRRL